MNDNIEGGVSPLKARRFKFKAGDVGKRATRKNVKLKTGFQRSGRESQGGRNYESLTQGSRLSDSLAQSLSFKQPGQPTDFGDTGVEDILGKGKEYKTEETGKTGNEFRDNCYDENGKRLHGKVYYSQIKKMDILCKWGGKGGSGSFDYKVVGGTKYEREYDTKNGKRIPGSETEWKEVK
tara:strand:+ start:259 stop:798 length:540 start_codon:yes stop_codon:yes gene_type:complete